MEYPIVLPGHEDLKLTLRTAGAFSSAKILYSGRLLTKTRGTFRITLPSDETISFKLKMGFDLYSPQLEFGGKVIDVVPALPTYLVVWAYLPLLMIVLGGALGGLCGGAATFGMLAVFHSRMPRSAKVALGLALPLVAFFAYVFVAGFVVMLTRAGK
jgi:hypothetical protein